jgi:Phosphorylase superfamily
MTRDIAISPMTAMDRRKSPQRPLLIVTGLLQEARIAAGSGMIVICSSSDPGRLRALLATVDSSSFRGVISFGVAGGLDPALESGDVVVATEVTAGNIRWLAGSSLNGELLTSIALKRRRVVRGGLAGVEQVIAGQSCAPKPALRQSTWKATSRPPMPPRLRFRSRRFASSATPRIARCRRRRSLRSSPTGTSIRARCCVALRAIR